MEVMVPVYVGPCGRLSCAKPIVMAKAQIIFNDIFIVRFTLKTQGKKFPTKLTIWIVLKKHLLLTLLGFHSHDDS